MSQVVAAAPQEVEDRIKETESMEAVVLLEAQAMTQPTMRLKAALPAYSGSEMTGARVPQEPSVTAAVVQAAAVVVRKTRRRRNTAAEVVVAAVQAVALVPAVMAVEQVAPRSPQHSSTPTALRFHGPY